jgi:hypothetical protein
MGKKVREKKDTLNTNYILYVSRKSQGKRYSGRGSEREKKNEERERAIKSEREWESKGETCKKRAVASERGRERGGTHREK